MKKPEVMDTTLRDGEQMEGVSFNSIEKLLIARRLFDIGVGRIEVASARAVEEDRKAVEAVCRMAEGIGKLDRVEVLGFVDNKKSIDWIYGCGCKTVNLLAKGSKEQCEGQLGKTLEEHLIGVKETVQYAKEKGLNVNVYLEDWSRGMLNSKADHVLPMIKEVVKIGVKRIMLPDTLGVLSTDQTREFLGEVKAKFLGVHFDYHTHNDYGLATANTLEAIKIGIDGIHVTANKLGERAGNCSLYEAVAGAKDFLGIDLGIDESSFYKLSRLVERASKIRLPPNCPIVGINAYTQTAGIHADGDKKGGLYKSKLRAERFGKVPAYALGKQSGEASISMNLREMGIEVDNETIGRLTSRTRELGERKSTVTVEDLYFLLQDELEQPMKRPFEFLESKAEICLEGAKLGYVRVRINEEVYEQSATGNGGYDAVMNALKTILDNKGIKLPSLVDYNPKIPPGGGTDALVETIIEWSNENSNFQTTGADTDQLISAVKATEKMVNLVLMRYK